MYPNSSNQSSNTHPNRYAGTQPYSNQNYYVPPHHSIGYQPPIQYHLHLSTPGRYNITLKTNHQQPYCGYNSHHQPHYQITPPQQHVTPPTQRVNTEQVHMGKLGAYERPRNTSSMNATFGSTPRRSMMGNSSAGDSGLVSPFSHNSDETSESEDSEVFNRENPAWVPSTSTFTISP